MSTEKSKTPDIEEIIFYLDLVSERLKKKTIIKGIKSFIQEKNTYSSNSTFGVVMFQEESNPITSYNNQDSDSICELINENWLTREKEMSFFENGLFEILSYIFGKSRMEPKNFRIIVLSDCPSDRNEDYDNALYDLVIKSKIFSTSIDIIRIGEDKFYSDDVRLKIITSETQGGIFYCEPEPRRFLDIIGSLIKNRKEFNIIKTDSRSLILDKDKPFYEKLAVDLITLDPADEEMCNVCDRELCPICEAYSDQIGKCYNCGLKYHSCCASLYSINNHIGEFIHIFKCPQCETLLKLDEDYVKMIYKEELGEEFEEAEHIEDEIQAAEESSSEEKYSYETHDEEETMVSDEPTESAFMKKETEVENLVDPPLLREEGNEPQEEEIKEPEEEIKVLSQQKVVPPVPPPPTRKIKVGGFFGTEIEVQSKVAETPSTTISKPEQLSDKKLSITSLKPPKRRSNIKFCKICGNSVTGTIICPNCGNKVLD